MAKQIIHSLVAKDGKYIVMPPWKEAQQGWGNLAHPNPLLAGGDSQQQYPTNTKFVDFDRTFIYGYCSTKSNAAVKSNTALFNYNTPINTCTWGDTAGVAGDTVCPFITSDLTGYTTVAVNYFAGGYLMPRSANPYGSYRVVSNTVYNGGASTDGDETDFVIESPGLQAAVDASSAYCYISRNPYTSLIANWLGGDTISYASAMGVSLIDPTASTYQWIQSWGPVFMLGDEAGGKAANLRLAAFHYDGTLYAGAELDFTTTSQYQMAGYIIDYTYVASAGVYGALIQLQLER